MPYPLESGNAPVVYSVGRNSQTGLIEVHINNYTTGKIGFRNHEEAEEWVIKHITAILKVRLSNYRNMVKETEDMLRSISCDTCGEKKDECVCGSIYVQTIKDTLEIHERELAEAKEQLDAWGKAIYAWSGIADRLEKELAVAEKNKLTCPTCKSPITKTNICGSWSCGCIYKNDTNEWQKEK